MIRRVLISAVLFGVLSSLVPREAARAELVVFTSGHLLKVDSFEVVGEDLALEISSGRMTVPMASVERIVDDEIVPESEAEVPAAQDDGPSLAFREDDSVPETPYGSLIYETARRHKTSPALVAAMVRAESAFDAAAVSVKGARGLMQLMPATARRFGVELADIHDPRTNLEAGVRYVKWLRAEFADDLPLVLAAYNAGEGNVARHGGVPPFRETRNYIRRIYSFLELEPSEASSDSAASAASAAASAASSGAR